MIFKGVFICYDSIHQSFASEGAEKVQNLNSERPASKIIRAVLRDSDIDIESATNYSVHRCYCNLKADIGVKEEEAFRAEASLDELGIKDGDFVFIRKIVGGNGVEDQAPPSKVVPRKRKEREDEDYYPSPSPSPEYFSSPSPPPSLASTSRGNLGNLTTKADAVAKTISTLLGGESWKNQSIAKLGPLQTRSHDSLGAVLRLVRICLEISPRTHGGAFNSIFVEALNRAYHQRISTTSQKNGDPNFFKLGNYDYERAIKLLQGRIDEDGSWEKSSISHLDESALAKPIDRFPLTDSGLTGPFLRCARTVSNHWGNDKWINQSPMPGLPPISLKEHSKNSILRQIAQLTQVNAGDSIPDGYPEIVLRVFRQAIEQRESALKKKPAKSKWVHSRDLPQALQILKKELGIAETSSSSSASASATTSRLSPSLDIGDGTENEVKAEDNVAEQLVDADPTSSSSKNPSTKSNPTSVVGEESQPQEHGASRSLEDEDEVQVEDTKESRRSDNNV